MARLEDDDTYRNTDENNPHASATKERVARRRAKNNVEKWGQQAPNALLAAISEELGELLAETLPDECHDLDGPEYDPSGALWTYLHNVKGTGLEIQHHLDDHAGPDNHVDVPVRDDMDVEAVREELYDLMALCYQLDWALYQGVRVDE